MEQWVKLLLLSQVWHWDTKGFISHFENEEQGTPSVLMAEQGCEHTESFLDKHQPKINVIVWHCDISRH